MSCPASGNCALTGTASDGNGHIQVYVLGTSTGDLDTFEFPPGTVALNVGGTALVNSVSCATDGNCALVGHYTDATGRWQPFIAEETGGTWQNAITVPGIAALDAGHFSDLQSVSCPLPGNCTAFGFYTDGSGNGQVFTTDEVNGTWGSAARPPGQSSQGIFSPQSHASCWSAGNCVSGGVVATPTALRAIVSVESPAASAALARTTATVQFGHEQSERLTVSVTPQAGGTPAGDVTIKAGQRTLATVPLTSGQATWTMPAKKLRPGTYRLTGTYTSSNGYDAATTGRRTLVVTG